MHTKKVGTTGRFGNKYGSKVRHAVAKIEASSRARHVCPQCLRVTLDRMSAGIWKCRKCNVTIAGGAYSPSTVASKIMKGEVEAFAEEAPAVSFEAASPVKPEEKKEAEKAEKPAKKAAKPKKARKSKEAETQETKE